MEEATGPEYIQQSPAAAVERGTDGGEDLADLRDRSLGASVPAGTAEENYIFHVMDFAAKIRERARAASQ